MIGNPQEDPIVRADAASALAHYGGFDPATRDQIVYTLYEAEAHDELQAQLLSLLARALGAYPDARTALLHLLRNPDGHPDIRRCVAFEVACWAGWGGGPEDDLLDYLRTGTDGDVELVTLLRLASGSEHSHRALLEYLRARGPGGTRATVAAILLAAAIPTCVWDGRPVPADAADLATFVPPEALAEALDAVPAATCAVRWRTIVPHHSLRFLLARGLTVLAHDQEWARQKLIALSLDETLDASFRNLLAGGFAYWAGLHPAAHADLLTLLRNPLAPAWLRAGVVSRLVRACCTVPAAAELLSDPAVREVVSDTFRAEHEGDRDAVRAAAQSLGPKRSVGWAEAYWQRFASGAAAEPEPLADPAEERLQLQMVDVERRLAQMKHQLESLMNPGVKPTPPDSGLQNAASALASKSWVVPRSYRRETVYTIGVAAAHSPHARAFLLHLIAQEPPVQLRAHYGQHHLQDAIRHLLERVEQDRAVLDTVLDVLILPPGNGDIPAGEWPSRNSIAKDLIDEHCKSIAVRRAVVERAFAALTAGFDVPLELIRRDYSDLWNW